MKTNVLSEHSRQFDTLRFAYPVVSRRSRGLSLGLNVNPDKICNFDCPYCQVDRTTPGPAKTVDFDAMLAEIDGLMSLAQSGELWSHPRFAATPAAMRRFNDIAFAGDGEPTTYLRLGDAIREVHALKQRHGLADVKTIVLTNATMLHSDVVRGRLRELAAGPYEIWAKLDAGTQPYFELVDGTTRKLDRIQQGITACAHELDVMIQTMIPTLDGKDCGDAEARAIGDRVAQIKRDGGRLLQVQVYTTARRPADSRIGMVADKRLDELAAVIQGRTDVPVQTYYGRMWE